MTNWASRSRRTWTRLAIGGESQRNAAGYIGLGLDDGCGGVRHLAGHRPPRAGGLGPGLGDGVHQGATPDEADQRQVPVKPRPEAALVVPQTQELFPILVEAFDGPSPVGELQLPFQGEPVQLPGEVPARLPLLAWQRQLPDQPALGAGFITDGAMHPDPAGLVAYGMLVPLDHRRGGPLGYLQRLGQFPSRVHPVSYTH